MNATSSIANFYPGVRLKKISRSSLEISILHGNHKFPLNKFRESILKMGSTGKSFCEIDARFHIPQSIP